MKLQAQYTTKLETAENPEQVVSIIEAKLEAVESPERVVDYIGLASENINATIDRINQAVDELKDIRKDAEAQLELIKIGGAKWMQEAGVDKLTGDRVSSVTILERKPKEETIITDEEELINQGFYKIALDKTAVKNAIKDGQDVQGAHIEVTHQEDLLKINAKKTK